MTLKALEHASARCASETAQTLSAAQELRSEIKRLADHQSGKGGEMQTDKQPSRVPLRSLALVCARHPEWPLAQQEEEARRMERRAVERFLADVYGVRGES